MSLNLWDYAPEDLEVTVSEMLIATDRDHASRAVVYSGDESPDARALWRSVYESRL